MRRVRAKQSLHALAQRVGHFLGRHIVQIHEHVVLGTGVQARLVRLNDGDEVIVVRIAVGLEPTVKAHGRRQNLEEKVAVLGRLEHAPDGARQHWRLHCRGEERVGEHDRVVAHGCRMHLLVP